VGEVLGGVFLELVGGLGGGLGLGPLGGGGFLALGGGGRGGGWGWVWTQQSEAPGKLVHPPFQHAQRGEQLNGSRGAQPLVRG